jgi:hypothetical protein
VLTSGCSTGVAGTPVAELWDPCTIPSEAIAAAGVNPTVIDSGGFDQDDNQWRYCSYRQDWFVLSIFSTTNSLKEIQDNAKSDSGMSTMINDRTAFSYSELPGTIDESCFVSLATSSGAIEFEVSEAGTEPRAEPLCGVAVRSAERLERATPR